jgi:NADP-dependent 3-hydroxy acid dehydrogenase YdfG
MEVSGKVVITTGASEGIGLATARLFVQQGASIALVARSEEKLQEIAASLPNAYVVPTDMRDEAAVRHMVA